MDVLNLRRFLPQKLRRMKKFFYIIVDALS